MIRCAPFAVLCEDTWNRGPVSELPKCHGWGGGSAPQIASPQLHPSLCDINDTMHTRPTAHCYLGEECTCSVACLLFCCLSGLSLGAVLRASCIAGCGVAGCGIAGLWKCTLSRRCTVVRVERVVLLRSLSSTHLTILATSRYRASSICFVNTKWA